MQESRESLGLHLEGSIIVIDEAHNLVDAVNNAHCAEASVHQLRAAEAQLSGYFERFRTRLASGSALQCSCICHNICLCCSLTLRINEYTVMMIVLRCFLHCYIIMISIKYTLKVIINQVQI